MENKTTIQLSKTGVAYTMISQYVSHGETEPRSFPEERFRTMWLKTCFLTKTWEMQCSHN